MKKINKANQLGIVDELFKIEVGLLRISQLVQDDIRSEVNSIIRIKQEVKDDKEKFSTAFENFDQKANQLFNMLSTVMKSMKEMNRGITRNLL